MDERIGYGSGAGFNLPQDGGGIAVEPGGIDGLAGGQVRGEFAQGFVELADGAPGVAALVVIEGYGDVNQGLQEEAVRAGFGRPGFLQNFVAGEEFAVIEEADSLVKQVLSHGGGGNSIIADPAHGSDAT